MEIIGNGLVSVRPAEKGRFAYYLGERLITSFHSQAVSVDGRAIDTVVAEQVGVRVEQAAGDLGVGQCAVVSFRAENGLKMDVLLALYEGSPGLVVQVVLADESGEVESRYLAPILTTYPNKQMPKEFMSYALRMVNVPYDNTMWVRYEFVPMRPGRTSYEVSALFDPEGRQGLTVGALDHGFWKNAVQCSFSEARCVVAYSGAADAATHDTQPHGSAVGATVSSARFYLRYDADFREGLEAYADAVATISPINPWSHGVPFGWNSWSGLAFRLSIDAYKEAGDLLFAMLPKSFQNDGTNYVNFDACWNTIPDEVIGNTVRALHARGQRAGIYGAPFAFFGRDVHAEMPGCPGHTFEEILMRDPLGNLLPRVDGAIPMDLTNPLWAKMTLYMIDKYVSWGFDYVKFDFLSHGGMEGVRYDPEVRTGRQAINYGYQLIRDALSEEKIGRPFFISLSIAPLFPAGYGHARRFSCDAFGHIDDTEYLLNALTYGWWQSGKLYAFNDPDHITLYKSFENDEPTVDNEARARYTAAAIAGTVMMISDDYGPAGDAEQHAKSKERAWKFATNPDVNAVARIGKSFRPVDQAGVSACDAYTLCDEGSKYLALFNFGDEPKEIRLNLARAGLDGAEQLKELWSARQMSVEGDEIVWTLEPRDAGLFEVM